MRRRREAAGEEEEEEEKYKEDIVKYTINLLTTHRRDHDDL